MTNNKLEKFGDFFEKENGSVFAEIMYKIRRNTEELKQGLTTAFIDNRINSNLVYQSEFVSNAYKQGKKVELNLF